MAKPSDYIVKPVTCWRIGEENTGGGFNIYCGETRVAHTAEVSPVNAGRGEVVTSEQAKENATLIVNAVNEYAEEQYD